MEPKDTIIETCRAFISREVEQHLRRVYSVIEPEYQPFGRLGIESHPHHNGSSVTLSIRTYNKPNEPPYDNLEGAIFWSLRDDYTFVLDAGLGLTSGSEWRKEIADITMSFPCHTDLTSTVIALLQSISERMIEEFRRVLSEIHGNLQTWILERENKT